MVALAAATSHAQTPAAREVRHAELSLSDETLLLRYITPNTLIRGQSGQQSYAVFLSEDRDVVGTAGLMIDTELRLAPRLAIQVGPQAYAALLGERGNDALALAFGVQARLELDRRSGLAIAGNAFYAPNVLTFGFADNLIDLMARAELRLADRIIGFAGWRWFELDLPVRQTRTLQDEIFVGIRYRLD